MLFIGVALLVAVGLALAISADAGSLVGLSQQQTGQLVPLLVILIFIAGGMFTLAMVGAGAISFDRFVEPWLRSLATSRNPNESRR